MLIGTGCTLAHTDQPCSSIVVYADEDGDGAGAGDPIEACVASGQMPPQTATIGGDCDDGDPTVTHLATIFADADHDGSQSRPASNDVSAILYPLAFSRPRPAMTATTPTRPSITWPLLRRCGRRRQHDRHRHRTSVGATPPPGFGTHPGTDCNDSDPSVTTLRLYYVDADGDGYGNVALSNGLHKYAARGYALDGSDPDYQNSAITPLDTDGDHLQHQRLRAERRDPMAARDDLSRRRSGRLRFGRELAARLHRIARTGGLRAGVARPRLRRRGPTLRPYVTGCGCGDGTIIPGELRFTARRSRSRPTAESGFGSSTPTHPVGWTWSRSTRSPTRMDGSAPR